MKKQRKILCAMGCAGLLTVLLLSGCSAVVAPPDSSAPAVTASAATSAPVSSTTTVQPTTSTPPSSTTTVPTTTTTTGDTTTATTTRVIHTTSDSYRPWIDFTSLEDYRQALLACATTDRIQQLLTEPPAQGWPNFTGSRYTMLTEDGYFLIPILPTGYTVEKITFSGYGASDFSVKMPSGATLTLSYYHYDYQRPSYPTSAWEDVTESTVKNSRGLLLHKEHTVSHYTDDTVGIMDRYSWTEGRYPFSVVCHYDEGETSAHEAFVVGLTFEKIDI